MITKDALLKLQGIKVGRSDRKTLLKGCQHNHSYFPNLQAVVDFTKMLANLTSHFYRDISPAEMKGI